MSSRKLPVVLLASFASLAACGDSDTTGVSASTVIIDTTETGNSMPTDSDSDSDSMSGDGDGDSGDGDGDGDSGDGDGDPAGDGDGDGDSGDGDGDSGDGDGDSGDGDGDVIVECVDLDQDGFGDNCDMGPDCNDDDAYNHTEEGCANCADADEDGHWVGCDLFDDNQPGVDCDDDNYNAFTEEGCMNCVDGDMDMFWVGCDQYGDDMEGPDCDDVNSNVGIEDNLEICDGVAQNCAGEIDNASPNEMCPPNGVNAPNVANWACNGEEGCEIVTCEEQFFDILDVNLEGGCECEGTTRTDSLAACSDDPAGFLGSLDEDAELLNIPTGAIPEIDNGLGNGAEDWYRVTIPADGGGGVRPNSGIAKIDFALNQGGDYRFEVFRSCGGAAFANGLALEFGAGAPPLQEWWFFDDHDLVDADYDDDVVWPGTVYIRVFRVQNDLTCNNYQLEIVRQSD